MKENKAIAQDLEAVRVALENSRNDPEIREALAEHGYGDEQLAEAEQIHKRLRRAYRTHLTCYGEKFAATDALTEAQDQADVTYRRFVRLARTAFKRQRNIRQTLLLDGPRRRYPFAIWVTQVGTFYESLDANPAIRPSLARYGVTAQALNAGLAQLEAAQSARSVRESLQGEAQEATELRDAAYAALKEWNSDFAAVAHVALADRPQLLEKLGITVK